MAEHTAQAPQSSIGAAPAQLLGWGCGGHSTALFAGEVGWARWEGLFIHTDGSRCTGNPIPFCCWCCTTLWHLKVLTLIGCLPTWDILWLGDIVFHQCEEELKLWEVLSGRATQRKIRFFFIQRSSLTVVEKGWKVAQNSMKCFKK